jgi:competence protein ComEC
MKIHTLGVWVLWALCGGFALGVFARSLTPIPGEYLVGASVLVLLGLVSGLRNRSILRMGIVCAVAVIAFFGGVLRTENAILFIDPSVGALAGQFIEIDGVVSGEPDTRATQVRVPVKVEIVGGEPAQADILAIFPAHTDVYYGERVKIAGILRTPEAFDAGEGREFNYPGFLAAQGIQFQLDRAQFLHGEGFSGNSFVAFSYRVKESFVKGLQAALPEPHAGLAGGITVGDKRALGKAITEEFRTVSLLHIVVLSGYNITIIISWLFARLEWAPRMVRFGTGIFVALFFAVMTGFASASLRAALMALIATSGSLSGRIYKPERALAVVGTGMIVWNPYLLVFDPGFQLSFLATAGLIAFSPIFSQWYARVPELWGMRGILVSSSSAQISVLPLILYQSGALSLVSLPANLLALVAVPYAMLWSAIAAIGGVVATPVATLIGLPAYILLSYVLGIAHTLASVPFAAVLIPAFSAWWLAPVYAGLFAYAIWRYKREDRAIGAVF